MIQDATCEDTYFQVLEFEENRGKVAVLNDVLKHVNTDLVALSDVSSLVSVDALLIASRHFSNSRVGVVNSSYSYLNASSSESRYWDYQTKIKSYESSVGSTLGAHGAFYLFRKSLFRPLPKNVINDDFYLPMDIVKQGFKAVHEPKIHAIEMENSSRSNDFYRRLRISAGNMQQLLYLKSLLLPRHGSVAFLFASGKGLRVLMPYLMIIGFINTAVLVELPFFYLALCGQIAIYAIALFNHLFPWLFSHKYCTAIRYLVVGHVANFIGGMRYLLGFESGQWKKLRQ